MATAKVIGHEYITIPALMQPLMGKVTPDYWATTAKEFNRIARELKNEGIGFAYHNHSFEFEKLPDGRAPYEVLLAETDPTLVTTPDPAPRASTPQDRYAMAGGCYALQSTTSHKCTCPVSISTAGSLFTSKTVG